VLMRMLPRLSGRIIATQTVLPPSQATSSTAAWGEL
jgi:hypothetical protein